MLAKVYSCAVVGLDGIIVEVEVDIGNGMPGIIVPRKTVGELQKLVDDPEAFVTVEVSDAKIRLSIGGIVMAVREDPGLSWLVWVSVPVLLVIVGLLVVRLMPLFQRMQDNIDGINGVMREQLMGIRVVRALGKKNEGADARRDLTAVERQLESLRGQRIEGAVERLMNEKPHARKATAKKATAKKATAKNTPAKKTTTKKAPATAATKKSPARRPRKST